MKFRIFSSFLRSLATTTISITFNVMDLVSLGLFYGFPFAIISIVSNLIDFVFSLVDLVEEIKELRHPGTSKFSDIGNSEFTIAKVLFGSPMVFLKNIVVIPNIVFSLYDIRQSQLSGVSSVRGGFAVFVLAMFYFDIVLNFGSHLARFLTYSWKKGHIAFGFSLALRFVSLVFFILTASLAFYSKLIDLGDRMYDVDRDVGLLYAIFLLGPFATQLSNYVINIPYHASVNLTRFKESQEVLIHKYPGRRLPFKVPNTRELLYCGMQSAFNVYRVIFGSSVCLAFMYQLAFFDLADKTMRTAVVAMFWVCFMQGTILGAMLILLIVWMIGWKIVSACWKESSGWAILFFIFTVFFVISILGILLSFFKFGPITTMTFGFGT